MKLVRDSPLMVGWRTWEFSPDDRRVVVVIKATVDLVQEGVCPLADEQEFVTGDLFWDDDVERTVRYASDMALVKPSGEMWVSGALRVADPVRELACRVRVAGTEVRFDVVGDRWWRADGGMTPPVPFTEMELCWERSFGGPGFKANPVGRGIGPDPSDPDGRVSLPNVERHGRLVRSPSARPKPIGGWPIPRGWPERAALVGTYGGNYLRERWPYLAEDFSWRHFQAAREEQRIAGFWRGDEEVELANLHPRHRLLRCRLPGLKPRAFLHDKASPGGALREVGVVLDTVAIDAGSGKAFLVWRGSAPCQSEGLEEIEHLYVTHELLSEVRSEKEYRESFVARLRTLWEEEQAFEAESPPSPAEPPAPEAEPVDEPVVVLSVEGLREQQRADALEQGWPKEVVETLYPEEKACVAVAPDSTAVRVQLEGAIAAAATLDSPHVAEALRRRLAELEAVPRQEEAPSRVRAEPPPGLWASQEHRDLVQRRISAEESLAGLNLAGADLGLLDLSGQDLSGVLLLGADLEGANLTGANLTGANLDEAKLEGASFKGAILRGATFVLVEASGVDFSGADLEEALFERAILTGANFQKVNARSVTIEECLAVSANFDLAQLEEAEMARSNFDEANFRGASMMDARVEGSSLRSACLDQVNGPGLRASDGADLSEARLRWAKFPSATFSESVLIGTKFAESDLTRASFVGARMEGAELLAVAARSASFRDARMAAASLAGADLLGACFEGAQLRLADLSGANCFQAEFWRADVENVRLDGANLEGTKLA